MSQSLQDKRVITRKEHICIGCMKDIPTGSPARYTSGTYEGEFYSNYFCDPCDEYVKNLDHKDQIELWEYGFTGGDIGDWRRELEHELAQSAIEPNEQPSHKVTAAES